MKTYKSLIISNPDELVFGISLKPVKCRSGLVIGGGVVYPEINIRHAVSTQSIWFGIKNG